MIEFFPSFPRYDGVSPCKRAARRDENHDEGNENDDRRKGASYTHRMIISYSMKRPILRLDQPVDETVERRDSGRGGGSALHIVNQFATISSICYRPCD